MPKPLTSSILSLVILIVLRGGAGAQTNTPVQSFVALQSLVKADQEIVVWGDNGDKTRGRVVTVSGDTLEIRRPPRFFGADRRQVFLESSVRRIEHRDSTTVYGGLIGFAAGLALAISVYRTSPYCEDPCYTVYVFAPLVGPFIGAAIDGAINRTLYISPASTKGTSERP